MTLMFDKSQVEEASDPLVRILRNIFYIKGITLDDFSTLYAQHGKRLGWASHITNTNRNNARKALLHHNKMTFTLFKYILLNVLRLEIVEFGITVFDEKSGERVNYKNTDKVMDISIRDRKTNKTIQQKAVFNPHDLKTKSNDHEVVIEGEF